MTAVEFLEKELNKFIPKSLDILIKITIEQAKELEKKQIIDACYFGSQDLPYEVKDKSEQYYNEQFKQP